MVTSCRQVGQIGFSALVLQQSYEVEPALTMTCVHELPQHSLGSSLVEHFGEIVPSILAHVVVSPARHQFVEAILMDHQPDDPPTSCPDTFVGQFAETALTALFHERIRQPPRALPSIM
ncbi:hypothetical protein MB27_28010 [Actinoplanes utahensis]|uniref:Uncharacterized protein n=1 Tax=Actinoplanes utahensis TaxID=1869 RepID=A0A0A6UGH3_ACTUT|nr:hypothetical protein MB27_28010 [Actinoplanes utahensis]